MSIGIGNEVQESDVIVPKFPAAWRGPGGKDLVEVMQECLGILDIHLPIMIGDNSYRIDGKTGKTIQVTTTVQLDAFDGNSLCGDLVARYTGTKEAKEEQKAKAIESSAHEQAVVEDNVIPC